MTTTPMRPAAALVTALMEDMAARSFVDLVRGRIYAPELPRDENGNIPQEMPMPCVVVQAIGGGSLGPGARSYVPWRVTRVATRCYAVTPALAEEVDATLYAYLTQLNSRVTPYGVIQDLTVSGGPVAGRDPDTDWPFYYSVFDLSMIPV